MVNRRGGDHKRNTKQKRKRTRKRKVSQKGGFCAPCLMGPIFAGAGLGASGIMMSSRINKSIKKGKQSIKRQEKYEINENGRKYKREFKQNDKRVYDGKKMSKYDNLKEASNAYNSLIKKCKAKGFQKC